MKEIIQLSSGLWYIPVVHVPKDNGEVGICTDFEQDYPYLVPRADNP